MEGLVSRVLKTEEIDWREARWLQNEELKELDDEALERLCSSLAANSFVMPFNVWEDGEGTIWILDGHHRHKALEHIERHGVPDGEERKQISIPDRLPATFIRCESRQEAAKLVLIYSSIYAKIKNEGLDIFLKLHDLDLTELKHEIDLPEFSLPRFEQKFNPTDMDGEDDFHEEDYQSDIVVQHGDIFRLGRHILYCGDCFNPEVWEFMLDGKRARGVFTDPPFNLPADYIGNKGENKHKDFAMGKGEMSETEFRDFLRDMMQQMCRFSVDGAIHYVCMDFRHAWHMTDAAGEAYGSIIPKQLCVWNKSNGANGSFYRAKHELVFVFKHGTAKHRSHLDLMDRTRYNVWDYPNGHAFNNPDRELIKEHPTPKPVTMVADAMRDTSDGGEIWLDLFLGSGTTLIAAEATGRICYGTEIEPKYCQLIIKRYHRYCRKHGKQFDFFHVNGDLNVEEIIGENGGSEKEKGKARDNP